MRRVLTKQDKIEIGLSCCNCNSTDDLEYHHIMPISLGGSDTNKNIACMCGKCHRLLHGYKDDSYINHGELIKSGMANARDKGSVLGRPKVTSENIPSVFMKYYPKYKQGEMNVTELSKLCDMSRTTIYKYLNMLGDNT